MDVISTECGPTTAAKDFARRRRQALRTVLAEQLYLMTASRPSSRPPRGRLEKAKLAHYERPSARYGLPDMDGASFCKLMRRQGVRAPVIMLNRGRQRRRHHSGLDPAPNDYVTKPFGNKRPACPPARLLRHTTPSAASAGDDRSLRIHPAGKMLMRRAARRRSG